jgi:hypothetical protein
MGMHVSLIQRKVRDPPAAKNDRLNVAHFKTTAAFHVRHAYLKDLTHETRSFRKRLQTQ